MEQFLSDLFGVDRKQSILNDTCAVCGRKATEFRSELERKEFSISGLCSACQQKIFN